MKEARAYRIPLHFKIIRPIAKAAFRGIFRTLARVKISGKENIPYGKPYVVAINHVSIFDPPFAGAFWPEELEMMGASDVFEKPGQGQVLRLYGVIPVHRGEIDRPLLTKVIWMINSGRPMLIAPEGTRSHIPGMQRAKPGIAYIIEKTGVPVLPAAIVGTTEDFWQRAIRGKRPPLEMRIGKPITLPSIMTTGSEKHTARQRNADLVMSYLAALLPEEYRGVYAESTIPSP
ncbi:MAG TPA: lysophospholipid acyltransferase family protein [Anaerolineales bacterium]|nr:lysophospholipid acyltransferase family protein [Anaerolineales bacterium]